MPRLGFVNVGALATGVLAAPRGDAESILVTVIPGLIDSHCHVVLGDYTPRQKTVDFLAAWPSPAEATLDTGARR